VTHKRIIWGLQAGRRIAAALGAEPEHVEEIARKMSARIVAIAQMIQQIEQRRGPRDIALFMLRHCAGRHALEIAGAVVADMCVEDAAGVLLYLAETGPRLATDNPRPTRTPKRRMRVAVFHSDGRRTTWERSVERVNNGGDPARQGGRHG
jgi:hypothetical protein